MGGDGTINKIAGGIYEGGCHSILGILPSGTVNNFAKSLGIPVVKMLFQLFEWPGKNGQTL